MIEITGAVVCGILSLVALFISIRSFQEKGYLVNNAYILVSREEREKLDKKPYYRQSAIVFLIVSLIFLGIAIEFIILR